MLIYSSIVQNLFFSNKKTPSLSQSEIELKIAVREFDSVKETKGRDKEMDLTVRV